MTRLLPLLVLVLADVAAAQIATPPPCRGAVMDRLVFRTPGGVIKFHLKFHDPSGSFDARSVVKLHRHGGPDPSCNDGDVLDYVIDQLVQERNAFLPRP